MLGVVDIKYPLTWYNACRGKNVMEISILLFYIYFNWYKKITVEVEYHQAVREAVDGIFRN